MPKKRVYSKSGARKCLRCGKTFNSTGPGNRICGKCNTNNRYEDKYQEAYEHYDGKGRRVLKFKEGD